MIRLNVSPSVLKSVFFNKEKESLDITFKDDINTEKQIDILMSIIHDYITSIEKVEKLKVNEDVYANLKIVHSNFAS